MYLQVYFPDHEWLKNISVLLITLKVHIFGHFLVVFTLFLHVPGVKIERYVYALI